MRGGEVGPATPAPIRQHFAAPPTGSSPESIAQGFLIAGSAPAEDYQASREYLTAKFGSAWVPRNRPVLVYDGGSPEATLVSMGATRASVRISGLVAATIDPSGRYVETPRPVARVVELLLVKEAGEWRIDGVPDDFGLWLSTFDVEANYRQFGIAYISGTERSLILDRRWLPMSNALPTTLARVLLDPVPPYLTGAVTSGFPVMARLAVEAVTVTDGVAHLDLTGPSMNGSAESRRGALAQALVTLGQAPTVTGVALEFDGRPLEVVGATGPRTTLPQLGFDLAAGPEATALVVRRGRSLSSGTLDDLRTGQPNANSPRLPDLEERWTGLAVSADQHALAATSADGAELVRLVVDSAAATGWRRGVVPSFGKALVRPAFDRTGLWLAGRDLAGQSMIWVLDSAAGIDTSPRPMQAAWLAPYTVLAVKMAPEGQRLAMLLRDQNGLVRVGVSGVARGPDRRPIGLDPPLFVGGSIVEARDLTWLSSTQVAVLSRTDGLAQVRPLVVGLDGRVDLRLDVPASPDASRVIGFPTVNRGVLVLAGGHLDQVAGNRWLEIGPVTDVVVPGG